MKNMPKKLIGILIVLAAVVLLGGIDQTTKDALKVQHILKTIERSPKRANSTEELSAEVTEKEVNAYITYRLAREKDPIINQLTVNLLGANQIQGKVSFSANQLNLGGIFGDNLDFNFIGAVQTRNNAARLNLTALSLGGYDVEPQVLNFVLSSAAAVYGTEVGGVEEWYALPKGIKRIRVQKAKAIIYY